MITCSYRDIEEECHVDISSVPSNKSPLQVAAEMFAAKHGISGTITATTSTTIRFNVTLKTVPVSEKLPAFA